MSTTVKIITDEELKSNKIKHSDLIKISSLGKYGFNADLLNKMNEFGIFPPVFKLDDDLYVLKVQIFGLVESLLSKNMEMYENAKKIDDKIAELTKAIADKDVVVTDEDIIALKDGVSIADIVESKLKGKG